MMGELKNVAETWLIIDIIGRIIGAIALITVMAVVGIKLWKDF